MASFRLLLLNLLSILVLRTHSADNNVNDDISCGVCKCREIRETNTFIVNCSDISNPNGTIPFSDLKECNDSVTNTAADFRRAEITKITSLDICRLINLTLDENRINKLPPQVFVVLDSLELLSIRNNTISNIDTAAFRGLRNLQYLDLSHNLIGKKVLGKDTFRNLVNLKSLKLNSNRIYQLDEKLFTYLEKLEYLDLSNNRLVTVSSTLFSSLNRLKYLSLAYNLIKSIPPDNLNNLPQLNILDLSNNMIMKLENDIFYHNTALTRLDISNNQISNATKLPVSLVYLSVAHNPIYKVEEIIKPLPILEELHVENSTLVSLNGLSCSSSVQTINASSNNISNFPETLFKQLTVLDISSNRFTSFPKGISSNNIPYLEELYIDSNPIKIFEFPRNEPSFKHLNILTLKKNSELTNLQSGAFMGISEVPITLRISQNINLASVSQDAFKNITVKEIDLSGNALITIPHNLLNWNSMELIDLQNNPWHCDCSLQWMLDDVVTTMYKKDSSVLNELRCASPEFHRNRRMVHYYNWTKAVFCTEFERVRSLDDNNANEPTIGTSYSTIIIIVAVGVVLFLLIGIGIYFERRRRLRIRSRNRRH